MSELKPCPFCGGAVTWENPHRDRGGQVAGSAPYYFVCRQCGYFFNFGFKSQYKNVEMWNKRALVTENTNSSEVEK